MKKRLFFNIAMGVSLIGLMFSTGFAGNHQMNTKEALKAQINKKDVIELNWKTIQGADKYVVYRAEVTKKPKSTDPDYSKMDFKEVTTVNKTEYTDKAVQTDPSQFNNAQDLVYYIAGQNGNGKVVGKTKYAEVKLASMTMKKPY